MVRPLSKRRRVSFLFIFVLCFIVFLPVVVLYSSGYRLGENFSLVKVGGIYVRIPYDSATLYLNDKEQGTTSFFKGSFFIENLIPKKYALKVKRDGYTEWSKNVYVKEQMIAGSEPILLPKNIAKIEIIKIISATSSAASDVQGPTSSKMKATKDVQNPEYQIVSKLFATTTSYLSHSLATSTGIEAKLSNKVLLYKKDSKVIASWTGNQNVIPDFMCDKENCSIDNIVVSSDVSYFDFFPNRNDVIIYSDREGVHVQDIDRKSPQNKVNLSEISGSSFRIGESGELYLKEGVKYYLLDLAQK